MGRVITHHKYSKKQTSEIWFRRSGRKEMSGEAGRVELYRNVYKYLIDPSLVSSTARLLELEYQAERHLKTQNTSSTNEGIAKQTEEINRDTTPQLMHTHTTPQTYTPHQVRRSRHPEPLHPTCNHSPHAIA